MAATPQSALAPVVPPLAPTGSNRVINPWVIALVVALTTFMEVLDISIANVSPRVIIWMFA